MHIVAAMKTLRLSLALALASAVALVACQHERAAANVPPSSATPSTPGVTSMQSSESAASAADFPYAGDEETAADRLATARCDHEEHCEHVGTGLAFATLYECVSRVRASLTAELEDFGCHGTLASAGVEQCMSTIIGESCQQPSNDLAHLSQCRSAAVCATSRRGQEPQGR
jgi:hypothetical protein